MDPNDPKDPPKPPKELATPEEKEKLYRDEAFKEALRASIRSGYKGVASAECDELLQDALIEVSKAPVPKAEDERLPYCKAIAKRVAVKARKRKETRPEGHATSLDDDARDASFDPHTSTPLDIARARQVVGRLLRFALPWGEHRSWIRQTADGVDPEVIAARSGVAKHTVLNAVSYRRGEMKSEMIKNMLLFFMSLFGVRVVVGNVLYRADQVMANPNGTVLGSPSSLALALAAVIALCAFAGVAWLGRARLRVVLGAFVAATATAVFWSWWDSLLPGWESLPKGFTPNALMVFYAAEALVIAGAGGLLAWLAARRFGFLGFLAVLATSTTGGAYMNAGLRALFDPEGPPRKMGPELVVWAILLLITHAFVWWQGRLRKVTQDVAVPSGEASSGAAGATRDTGEQAAE